MSLNEAVTFWLFVSYFGGATQLIFGVELAALATAGWRKGWNARLETLTNEGLDLLARFDRVAAICCWWGAMGAAMLVLEHWAQGEWEVALKGAGIALIALALGFLADARSWSLASGACREQEPRMRAWRRFRSGISWPMPDSSPASCGGSEGG